MRLFVLIIVTFFISSCATDTNLYGNRANLYGGMGQSVNGDENNVSIFNLWKAEHGLPVAEQHCAKYGKKVVSYSQSGITGLYKCGGSINDDFDRVFELQLVKTALKKLGDCIRSNVVFLDDLTSDAKTISSAVSQICEDDFISLYELILNNHKDASSLTIDYKNKFKLAQLEKSVNRVIPYVLAWRRVVASGWDAQKTPTEKEIPDNIFEISI